MTSPLFSPVAIRDLTLKNRLVVSPMCQYSARHGFANDWHFAHLARFALGGFGTVMVEATGVTAEKISAAINRPQQPIPVRCESTFKVKPVKLE